MEILPAIKNRRSVRRFDGRPVEREKLLACVEAARLAPSAENAQPCRFLLLDDPETKNAFGGEVFSGVYRTTRWALAAPAIVAILVKRHFVVGRLGPWIQGTPYYLIDAGIAGEHFVLQAQSMGLGTCWIGWFNARRAKRFLRLPSDLRVAQLLAVGYPHPTWNPRPHRRRNLESVFSWNRWSE
jgi:nitroreductase